MGGTLTVTLDKSTLKPIGVQSVSSGPAVTLDKSTLKPINDPTYAGNAFPELKNDRLSRTLYNMTAAMSGQKLATPEDQAEGEKGRAAGFKAAALTAASSTVGGVLSAPAVGTATVGTGILDATGQAITREAIKYGPSVATQAARWIATNPVATAFGYHVARRLGIPLPKILDVLQAIGGGE